MVDRTKLDKFVGMLGSEHDGEQVNAARFIKRMAAAEKLSIVELLTKAYGGGGAERIIYRDRPAPAQPSSPPRRSAESDAAEMRRKREAEEDRRNAEYEARTRKNRGGRSNAYGHNGSMVSKIRTVLSYHSMLLTKWEKDFLEDLVKKVDSGYEMTPRQRASYMKIMEKAGYA